MAEIILSNRRICPTIMESTFGIPMDNLEGLAFSKPRYIYPYTPYLVSDYCGPMDRSILSRLYHPDAATELTNLSLSFGGDNVVALAEIVETLRAHLAGMAGTAGSVYSQRMGDLLRAVQKYQDALMKYREVWQQAKKSGSRLLSRQVLEARQKVMAAFKEMQAKFGEELKKLTQQMRSRRGTPLTSARRGMNIAESSRTVAKLHVTDTVQASRLVRFAGYTKFLGNGLAVIDFGGRAGHVHNTYQEGGDWERELFVESSRFAASALAGSGVAKAGAFGLGLIMLSTPVGWVGLVVGGLVIVGCSVAASVAVDRYVNDLSRDKYDPILEWIDGLWI